MRPDEESFSAAVTNTFIVGDITYTLKLRANAAFVGREDGEVTMPSELAPSENGSGAAYADGASVSNLPSADAKTAILYAQWNELHTLTLNYDANGGEGAPEAQSVYADAEYSFDISNKIPTYVSPSGVAYEFLGWSESPDREAALQYSSDGVNKEDASKPLATSVKVDYSEENASKTLYAVWKENAPEGGTQGDAAGTQSVNETPAAPAPEPVQPEVSAEGDVKSSDTDKTEPPKAETPESP